MREEGQLVHALVMVIAFLLVLITLVTEVQKYFQLGDFAIFLIVMLFVSVVPALGKPIYVWMRAEKEEESVRKELADRRTKNAMFISVLMILLLAARLLYQYLG